jgi:inner membrane protein
MAATLSVFYGFMFVIINMEDFSLLVGSLGLLFVLAFLMYVTRNIDWYKSVDSKEDV